MRFFVAGPPQKWERGWEWRTMGELERDASGECCEMQY